MSIYEIILKDNLTDEIKTINYDWPYSDDGLVFYWTEGNMSCDCNRYMEFYNDHETKIDCGKERFKLMNIKKELRNLLDESK